MPAPSKRKWQDRRRDSLAFLFLVSPLVLTLHLVRAEGSDRYPKYVITDPGKVRELNEAWDERLSWPPLPEVDFHIPLYAQFLRGVRLCLDPGHGGDADIPRYKRGPTDHREAVMNLGVALHLRDFLLEAGAEVLLTREEDVAVSIEERVTMANLWPADLFISLHHNAARDFRTNYTTVWFHGEPDTRPANLDLARFLQIGIADALRLPQVSANPLKSDTLMYPLGFGVLRGLEVTGCLAESSFFTNPYEEYRLKQDSYWKREAYGVFLGLARYAWMGLPRPEILEPIPGSRVSSEIPTIRIRLRTGLEERIGWGAQRPWVFQESIALYLNAKRLAHAFDPDSGILSGVPDAPLETGEHFIEVRYRNYNGNHCLPSRFPFRVGPPAERIAVRVEPERIPADGNALARIAVEVFDAEGRPVMDGTPVTFRSNAGRLILDDPKTFRGRVVISIEAPFQPEEIRIGASADSVTTEIILHAVRTTEFSHAAVRVHNAVTGLPVSGGSILWHTPEGFLETEVDSSGLALASLPSEGTGRVVYHGPGYVSTSSPMVFSRSQASLAILETRPLFGGALMGQRFVLNPNRTAGNASDRGEESGLALELNLRLAHILADHLIGAGAEAEVLRPGTSYVFPEEPDPAGQALYLHLDHRKAVFGGLAIGIPAESHAGLRAAAAILREANRTMGLQNRGINPSPDLGPVDTESPALSAVFYTIGHPDLADWETSSLLEAEGGILIRGMARYLGWDDE